MSDLPRLNRSADPELATGSILRVAVGLADDAASRARSAVERAAILEWLADLFATPASVATIAALRGGQGDVLFAALATDRAFEAAISTMRASLGDDDEVLVARLGIAFGRLFLGIGGPGTVAPYESVVTCGGRLFQAPTGEMERLLAAHDLSVADRGEPADHLAIEVSLLARLIGEGHPDRIGLAERLARWVPIFGGLVIDRDDTGFYAGAARLLVLAIERERGTSDVIETE
jgi:TorA specific chaperone